MSVRSSTIEGSELGVAPDLAGDAVRTIDATGKWVIPGMLDVHTHYDAEVLAAPGLGESVRHAVTTMVLGNCSLSTVYAGAQDCADLFARVEALPWDAVHGAVKEHTDRTDPHSYAAAIGARPLGANVAAFLGHSDIRVATMAASSPPPAMILARFGTGNGPPLYHVSTTAASCGE